MVSHLVLRLVNVFHLLLQSFSLLLLLLLSAVLDNYCFLLNLFLSFLTPALQLDLLTAAKVALDTQHDVVKCLVREVSVEDVIDLRPGCLAVLKTDKCLAKDVSDELRQLRAHLLEYFSLHALLGGFVVLYGLS